VLFEERDGENASQTQTHICCMGIIPNTLRITDPVGLFIKKGHKPETNLHLLH